ncbi:cytochrome c-type biogenesis protein [Xanthobacter sp. TB0139]|uniref:cytochrome c-type biogenesis protein n=1 Tax=Xanthobacter sp. TB0139 TaxID=3459178 RepID=UPI004039F0A8
MAASALGLSLAGAPGAASVALAVQADEVLKDPALEKRAREISGELRCLVCQNQSIDDSDAPLARDLRLLVRERLQAGDSNGQVMDYMVQRYGEFVLLRPRMSLQNALLWVAPLLVLVLGALSLLVFARRRNEAAGAQPLSAEEEAQLKQLLKEEPGRHASRRSAH